MGTFSTATPAVLRLEAWEETARATAIAATGSPSPVPFAALPALDPYTHLGHAAQYGKGRRNGRTVRMIVLHITDVDGSALGAASYDARRADLVSATAFIGPNGEIVYDVSEDDRPYTTGRWNDETLAAEIVGHDEWTSAQWRARPRQLEGIVRWLVAVCRRHDVPPVWLDAAAVAQGASRQGELPVQGTRRGITDHLHANLAARSLGASVASTSHICVGPGLRAIVLGELLPEVARRLAPVPPDPIPSPQEGTMFQAVIKGTSSDRHPVLLTLCGSDVGMTGLTASGDEAAMLKALGQAATIKVSDVLWDDWLVKAIAALAAKSPVQPDE